MIAAISSAFTGIISWLGELVTALVGESGALKELLPVFAIGIGVTVLFMAIKAVKSFIWGA